MPALDVLQVPQHLHTLRRGGTGALLLSARGRRHAEECGADQLFLAASTQDYCLKSLGTTFSRENVTLIGGVVATDIPDVNYATSLAGYHARVVAPVPLPEPHREKIVREFLLDAQLVPNALAAPNLLTLRIGNHFNLVDPMSLEPYCAPQWHTQDPLPMICPDTATSTVMALENERPSDPISWPMWETGNRLYFDLRITSANGGAPVEHAMDVSAIRLDVAMV